jgi:molybdate transport system regulatory protein
LFEYHAFRRVNNSRRLVFGAAGEHTRGMARLTIRIDLQGRPALGPGKARLLEAIDKEGSIRAAAAALGMSYRRAWLLVRDIESIMGAPVLSAAAGGVQGGGARLNRLGFSVLEGYRAIERAANKSAAVQLRKLSRLVKGARSSLSPRHRRRSATPAKRAKR